MAPEGGVREEAFCDDRAMWGARRRGESTAVPGEGPRRAGVYFPGLDGRGGAERLALVLALELARAGWATSVFTDARVDPVAIARDLGADVSSLTFVALRARTTDRSRLREVRRLALTRSHVASIRRHDLDLFVNAKYKSALPGCGRRTVYYCHFPHRLRVAGAGGARRLYLLGASALERALLTRGAPGFLATYDEVWANSDFTARHVRERWGRDAEVVYPPCEQVAPARKGRTIAVVGRFQAPGSHVPYKAQDVLLRTFASMSDLHAEGWRLVMVGGTTPEDATYLAGLRREAQGLPVTIVADGSREDVRALLGEASLYWHAQGFGQDARGHPETQEHFGISTVEAMSAGAIPLVHGSAGPAEVVAGVDGLRCWTDPAELAALTREWAARSPDEADPVRARCRSRAAEFDEVHFRRRIEGLA